MSYKVIFTPSVEESTKKWKRSNPINYKKFVEIVKDISLHPREGIGHPEPLRGYKEDTWSRRVSKHDRIIYDIYDEVVTVLVIQVEGHYNDK